MGEKEKANHKLPAHGIGYSNEAGYLVRDQYRIFFATVPQAFRVDFFVFFGVSCVF